MPRTNGKTQIEEQQIDAGHELPASDETENQQAEGGAQRAPESHVSEAERLRVERDTLLDRLARAQAEFDNARKRAAKEQQDFRDYAQVDTIKTILPVLDSFERALQSFPQKSEFRNGVDLIYKQLQDALAKLGVRPVPTEGEQFDPRYHEAVEMVDTEDAKDHQVLDELQRGYKLKDRLLRPAMVRVARNPKH
jgi:molecular chaperone GrpE